ncbi:hypothetical protein F7725_020715 [Dissostichus mawsoni]|uniref:Uncharacterized protein n=1 Tax=Dissostichus mawsoni TaxID=36200 RepID=A0A7J5YGQ7_DISMA|nr:hypothetical protein F7725_020715 [Dissostichus mawsoni]
MESDLQPREVVVLHLSQQVAALLQRKVKDVPALGECWRSSSDCEDQALCGSLTSLTQVAREIKRLAGERAKDKDICLLASATDVAIVIPSSLLSPFLIRLLLPLLLLLPYSNWGHQPSSCGLVNHQWDSSRTRRRDELPSSFPNYQGNPTLSALYCHITLSQKQRNNKIEGELGPVLVDEDINGHSCRNCRDGHILPEIATPGHIWIGEASPALTPSTSGADTLRDSEEMHK